MDNEIFENGYSEIWLHHKGHNKHHFEYWLDPTHCKCPAPIPKEYVAELFCDRVALTQMYRKDKYTDGDPLAYFEAQRKVEQPLIDFRTYKKLHELFLYLSDHGEDATCEKIRLWIANKRDKYTEECAY